MSYLKDQMSSIRELNPIEMERGNSKYSAPGEIYVNVSNGWAFEGHRDNSELFSGFHFKAKV